LGFGDNNEEGADAVALAHREDVGIKRLRIDFATGAKARMRIALENVGLKTSIVQVL